MEDLPYGLRMFLTFALMIGAMAPLYLMLIWEKWPKPIRTVLNLLAFAGTGAVFWFAIAVMNPHAEGCRFGCDELESGTEPYEIGPTRGR